MNRRWILFSVFVICLISIIITNVIHHAGKRDTSLTFEQFRNTRNQARDKLGERVYCVLAGFCADNATNYTQRQIVEMMGVPDEERREDTVLTLVYRIPYIDSSFVDRLSLDFTDGYLWHVSRSMSIR